MILKTNSVDGQLVDELYSVNQIVTWIRKNSNMDKLIMMKEKKIKE